MAKINKPAGLILVVTVIVLAAVAAIAAGALNFIADDGTVGTGAIESLITYWVVFCLVVLVAVAIKTRPLEVTLTTVSILVALVLA